MSHDNWRSEEGMYLGSSKEVSGVGMNNRDRPGEGGEEDMEIDSSRDVARS